MKNRKFGRQSTSSLFDGDVLLGPEGNNEVYPPLICRTPDYTVPLIGPIEPDLTLFAQDPGDPTRGVRGRCSRTLKGKEIVLFSELCAEKW